MNFAKLFHTKSIKDVIQNAKDHPLKKTLGGLDMLLLGIGCTIGTGIFVLTGIAAAEHAGPAIALSYILAGLACMFAGLAYTELAAMMKVAGGAYTYSYTVLGEFVAWMVGCGLILEYTVGASTVCAGWSGYMVGILQSAGIIVPEALTKGPFQGGIINLPAILIALFVGMLLIRGTKESVWLNRVLVTVKLGAIFLFIIVATPYVNTHNWTDNFMPFGFNGVIIGAATIFFAYVGFDSVATAAEECKNPSRDLPIGIIGSLLVSAILYVAVSLMLTGIVPYASLDNPEPLARALRMNGSNIGSALVATGAIAGMTSVILVLLYGQSRIFFVMSRDKLLPSALEKIHKKFGTPYLSCLLVMVWVMIFSGLIPLQVMGHITSFGTLFAFTVAAVVVMVLRIKEPNIARPFKCPMVFVIAPAAIIACGYLMISLLLNNVKPFLIWAVISVLVYFAYGYKRGYKLAKSKR